MAQAGNNAAAHALQSSQTDGKVEVVLEQQAGVERVAIKYSTWTEGLGWCSQKTIHLDVEQLDELHRAVAVARQRLRRQRAASGQLTEPAQVIQLPTLA